MVKFPVPNGLRERARAGLVAAVSSFSEQWVEWGAVEYVYARANPDDFAELIRLRRGHRAQTDRDGIPKHHWMASWYLSNQVLRRSPDVRKKDGRRTSAWTRWESNGPISYWTMTWAQPTSEQQETWEMYCQQHLPPPAGIQRTVWDMDCMSYVPPGRP